MSKLDTSYEALVEAMARFDRDLRDARDWQNWTEDQRRKYAILHNGRRYPVKQIISMATGVPLSKFVGGESQPGDANHVARKYGLTIESLRDDDPDETLAQGRNPQWTRDELIITLDFYLQHRGALPGKESSVIEELSRSLNRIGQAMHLVKNSSYRNVNGVHMRLMNFLAYDPTYPGAGLKNGGAQAKAIWDEFSGDPDHCRTIAGTILASLQELEQTDPEENVDDSDYEAPEGWLVTRRHRIRERNREIVKRKKASAKGKLACEACELDFSSVYGPRGQNFIECHHTKPVHEMAPGEKTKLKDLALLCANCHRMVHAQKPWLTVKELKSLPGVVKLREANLCGQLKGQ